MSVQGDRGGWLESAPGLSSEWPGEAILGEPSEATAAVVVEDLSELIARVGQDAGPL
jgi:hypothetical protein